MVDKILLERLQSAEKKNIALQAELELTKRAIARLRAERKYNPSYILTRLTRFYYSLVLDRFYKQEVALVDVGAMSDEDLGLQIEPEANFDWAELEASMSKKGLLKAASKPTHTISVPNKRRFSNAGVAEAKPAKVQQLDSQADESAHPSQQKSKRVIKTAEASAAVPRKAQSVPMDETGRPILPVTCGIVTVHELGHVVSDRQPFHNKRYIWPVGFKSSRQYMSAVDPEANVTYYSEIKDGGSAPVFEVWAEDAPEQKYQSSTSTGVWTSVFKAAAAIRGKEASNSASGPDFYGFSNNTIAMLIETLPGVENCLNYQKKNFEISAAPAQRMRASMSMPKLDSAMTNGEQDVDVEAEETNQVEQEEAAIDLFELAARAVQHQESQHQHYQSNFN